MKKSVLIVLIFVLILIISGCTSSQIPPETPTPSPTIAPTNTATSTPIPIKLEINIPSGTIPTINGRIEEGEWDAAAVEELNDGTLLYLMYSEDALYLALDSEVLGTVNLGILRDGELWVLHSSAALGSVVYQPFADGWQMSKTFEWCCRTTSPLTESEQLLEQEGWLSHNQFVGDQTQTEYLIRIPKDEIIIAVTYRYRDDSDAAYWPETLGDNDLLMFTDPVQVGDMAVFSDEMWAQLIVTE